MNSTIKSHQEFANQVKARHGDIWIWYTNYEGANRDVSAVCRERNHLVTRNSQLFYNHGCPDCSYIVRGEFRRTSSAEIYEIVETRDGKVISATYGEKGWDIKVECAAGHRFNPALSSLKSGSWCGYCGRLRSERLTRMIIEAALGLKLPKRRPEILKKPGTGYCLEFDGYDQTHSNDRKLLNTTLL